MRRTYIVLLCIILFTGLPSSILIYPIFVNVIVALLIGVGVLGLHTAYLSHKCKDRSKAWVLMIVGFMSLMLAHITLEGLL